VFFFCTVTNGKDLVHGFEGICCVIRTTMSGLKWEILKIPLCGPFGQVTVGSICNG